MGMSWAIWPRPYAPWAEVGRGRLFRERDRGVRWWYAIMGLCFHDEKAVDTYELSLLHGRWGWGVCAFVSMAWAFPARRRSLFLPHLPTRHEEQVSRLSSSLAVLFFQLRRAESQSLA